MRAILQGSCWIPWGYVAEFAEGARQGQLPWSESRGGSHSVERFGRRASGVFLLAPPEPDMAPGPPGDPDNLGACHRGDTGAPAGTALTP